jgi:hypothetical protein
VFGDDLKLTNLVLAAGYESVFEPTAMATTKVPTTLRRFVRQQLRWNRSFYRELPQMRRLVPGAATTWPSPLPAGRCCRPCRPSSSPRPSSTLWLPPRACPWGSERWH